MDEYKNIVCLICLDTFADGMESAFTDENDSAKLSPCGYLYERILNLEIPHQLDSPKLCQTCCLLLKDFDDFKTKANESHSKLSKLLDAPTEVENLDDSIDFELKDFHQEIKIEKIDDSFEEQQQQEESKFTVDPLKTIKTEPMAKKEIVIDKNEKTEPKVASDVMLSDDDYGEKKTSAVEKEVRKKMYECCSCNKVFRTQSLMNAHRRDFHPIYKYKCPYCPRSCRKFYLFELHIRSHGDESYLAYKNSSKEFRELVESESLAESAANEDNIKWNQCQDCGITFESATDLTLHWKGSHNIVPQKCPHCPKIISQLDLFELHLRKEHKSETENSGNNISEEKPMHDCDKCGEQFQSKQLAIEHWRKEHKELIQKCPKCPKTFRRTSLFELHLQTHLDVSLIECSICKKQLNSKANYGRHIKIHRTERDFICHLCGKQFLVQSELQTHVRVLHKKERPYVCDTCGKKFLMRSHLTNHLYLHTGGIPCSICSKTLSNPAVLKKHIRIIHHKIKTHQCHICSKLFNTKWLMGVHIKKHHGIQ